jgi:uncharacterized MAPEG superfamily protein
MGNLVNNSAFQIYAITSLVLCINLLFLWAYSGAQRGKTKTSPNAEDVARFGGILSEVDPPEVARILRVHRNAQASIYPFLLLGLIFVLAGGTGGTAAILFGTFAVARLLHSFFYLRGKQPWRTFFFIVGGLATLALMMAIVWLLIRVA